mgnify:CR=1 FL=1
MAGKMHWERDWSGTRWQRGPPQPRKVPTNPQLRHRLQTLSGDLHDVAHRKARRAPKSGNRPAKKMRASRAKQDHVAVHEDRCKALWRRRYGGLEGRRRYRELLPPQAACRNFGIGDHANVPSLLRRVLRKAYVVGIALSPYRNARFDWVFVDLALDAGPRTERLTENIVAFRREQCVTRHRRR